MTKITRRKFIKITSIGTAGLALSGVLLDAVPKLPEYFDNQQVKESELNRTPTVCEVCFWKCAGWVYTDKKGKIIKVIGNEKDPNSNGRLCPRGTGGIGMYYDTDRLKNPLIRVKKGEEETFKEVSWDEALDFLAKRMKEIADKHGFESFALFDHGTTGAHFDHLFKAMGSENIAEPAIAQCLGSRQSAFGYTYGVSIPTPEPVDFEFTKCLVLIGNHYGENMHNGYVQGISKAIERGMKIITVDPRFSTAASKSEFWLPIKPATDIPLLLAWIHILIYENLYDKKYVEKYTFGFEQLKEHVKNYTPEWAAAITTLNAADIRQTAYEMANAAPSVAIHPGRHVAWYGDDTQRLRAIAIINALLGAWGRKGGFYLPQNIKLPPYPVPEFPEPKWTWKDITLDKYKGAFLGVTNVLRDATLPDTEYEHKIKAWFCVATNPLQSLPQKELTLKAIQNLDLLVVVETMPSEIVGFADVVLPEATYFERYDYLRTMANKQPNIALRMPAVEPKFNSKPGWWIARQIGIKLGLEKYFPWEKIEDVLDWQLKQVGLSLEQLKKEGVVNLPLNGNLYIPEGADWEFGTASGKIELYSTDLEAMGQPPMPVYTAHEEPPYGFFHFIYGRAPMHTFGRTINNPFLAELMSENSLWVHPSDAKMNNLSNNQKVWLQNQDGVISSFPVKIRITERIRRNCVFMVHGFGHSSKQLSRAFGKGASDSELITKVKIDPVNGGTGMRNNFVKILTQKPV